MSHKSRRPRLENHDTMDQFYSHGSRISKQINVKVVGICGVSKIVSDMSLVYA